MEIKHSVELEDGSYTFQGTLTGKELDFIVEYGINQLLVSGAMPLLKDNSDDSVSLVMPEHNTAQ